nr:hypothetical protein [Candidatus Cloacimonadota bacterium]
MKKILILCTGNSCRSIMAEAMINYLLGDRYEAYSAGVAPSTVNPMALKVLQDMDIDTSGLRSKNVSEFLAKDDLDMVITVCDHAKESCPVFSKPIPQIHIGIEDPAPYTHDPDAMKHFLQTKDEIMDKLISFLRSNA